jgi:hypothetical protein
MQFKISLQELNIYIGRNIVISQNKTIRFDLDSELPKRERKRSKFRELDHITKSRWPLGQAIWIIHVIYFTWPVRFMNDNREQLIINNQR